MGLLTLVGGGMMAYSAWGIFRLSSQVKREVKEVLTLAFDEANLCAGTPAKRIHPRIDRVENTEAGWRVDATLPIGITSDKVKHNIKILEEATASSIKIKRLQGRQIQLDIGTLQLEERMDWTAELIQPGTLTIPYFTPFGVRYLDFMDEAVCHLITAGATRMGKSVFLRLLFVHLILSTKGKIQFFYINNKLEDYYPFADVPQIPEPAESITDAFIMLNQAKGEILRRKDKLRSQKKAVNVKQWNEMYPSDQIPPLFIVFDEYGRFAESDEFQELVVEISETAGYLDVHLVIATQRPDATTVLNPRIRANILTRVCFQTADESNSKIVVHTPDAFNLGEVRGRSIVLDGTHQLAQIPYISEAMTTALLEPYKKAGIVDDEKGSGDFEVSEALPGFVTGSLGEIGVPGGSPAEQHDQPDHAPAKSGWFRLTDPAAEGAVLPLHAEPGDDSHPISEDQSFLSDSGLLPATKQTKGVRGRAKHRRNL
jgi:S-DNA-T family DNA segregation ATPase FtsK/SpoIIIE